jgi:hypothetical protein
LAYGSAVQWVLYRPEKKKVLDEYQDVMHDVHAA